MQQATDKTEEIREECFFREKGAFGAFTQQENRSVKAREIKGVTYNPTEITCGSFSKLAEIRIGFWGSKISGTCLQFVGLKCRVYV